eukprot:Polyplicarium_translucidae@DN3563_c0_g1_i1.p1
MAGTRNSTAARSFAPLVYAGRLTKDEILISDGSKADLCRLQFLFGSDTSVAVQDPVYPVYVDGSVLAGKSGEYNFDTQQYRSIVYMRCLPEENFFPELENTPRTDVIYFCSPNNPTGEVATREQLAALVRFARKNRSVIIYDSAYSAFISDSEKFPRSIFEIEGSEDVAIETSSLSKSCGFTGVRLGWVGCPKALRFDCGRLVHTDLARIWGTCLNGASRLSENGALFALSKAGQVEVRSLVDYYMTNARLLRGAMESAGFTCYGGQNCPYIWVKTAGDTASWDMFQQLLEKAHLVTVPGAGFGRGGEGFLRLSAFAGRDAVEEAVGRIPKYFSA